MVNRYGYKVQQIVGGSPARRVVMRLDAMVPKLQAAGEEWPNLEIVAYFDGDGLGEGHDAQAAARRQVAVAWSLDTHGELVPWLEDVGVVIEDGAPAELPVTPPLTAE